jgi:hypothetical protein
LLLCKLYWGPSLFQVGITQVYIITCHNKSSSLLVFRNQNSC